MFEKILVGIDGSARSGDVIKLAGTLAGSGTQLVVVLAYPRAPQVAGHALGAAHEATLRAEAEQVLATAVADRAATTRAVADPSPARAIHELAEREQADLIVIGSSHRGRVGRVLLGDVSRAVLHGAPCPVAIAPHGYGDSAHELRQVGVAYVASHQGRAALAAAARIAEEAGAVLRLRTVVNTPVLYPGYAFTFDYSPYTQEQHRVAQHELDRRIAELPIAAEGDVVDGAVALELEALSGAVDLLVAGSRGWGPAVRVVLGSSTDRLSHTAQCPLLVVPPPAAAGGPRAAETVGATQAA
jgi:nucleotide-binding universal stress UspA family protein